jgi:hypothetical protein
MVNDLDKVWTTVGSTGVLNPADLAKVTLHQSIIQLGIEIVAQQPVAAVAAAAPSSLLHLPMAQAVARYNVTAVDGLFNPAPFTYKLELRCRGQIAADLIEVDLASGLEKVRIRFASDNHTNFEVQSVLEDTSHMQPPSEHSVPFDFINKAYYVEATLTASALVVGHPAAISIIQISAPTPIH